MTEYEYRLRKACARAIERNEETRLTVSDCHAVLVMFGALDAQRRSLGMGGAVCPSHGKSVLVTHVDDSEPCTDYLRGGA